MKNKMKYKIVITAGGTSEAIDNVRKITNSSSGKLGMVIAEELIKRREEEIEKIYYICAKNSLKPSDKNIEIIEIFDTKDLQEKVQYILENNQIDYFIHSMAVSDYTVDYITTTEMLAEYLTENPNKDITSLINENKNIIKETKISSNEENLIIKLKKTPKIISMIKKISPKTFLVGFKLLDDVKEEELIKVGIKLKDKNNCNLVVANDLEKIRGGEHKAFIIDEQNRYITAHGKEDIANKLINKMFNYYPNN